MRGRGGGEEGGKRREKGGRRDRGEGGSQELWGASS